MKTKTKKKNGDSQAIAEEKSPLIPKWDKETTQRVEEPTVNPWGLDLTDPNRIKFQFQGIEITVIGCILTEVQHSFRVTLMIQKRGNVNPIEIYRMQNIDLFSENDYHIKSATTKTKIETSKLKEALADLTSRLDKYRSDKLRGGNFEIHREELTKGQGKIAKRFLQQENLLEVLNGTIQEAGVIGDDLGLKLFILGLSRITKTPLHCIVQGKHLLAQQLLTSFSKIVPVDHINEITSMSKSALVYPPYSDYWQHKLFLFYQLDGILGNGSSITEYMEQGQLRRVVTEIDRIKSSYRSEEKIVTDTISVIGYTTKDFHPVFKSSNVVCLNIQDTDKLNQLLTEREISHHAGVINEQRTRSLTQHLILAQQRLKMLKVVNPFLQEVDLTPFFKNNLKHTKQFLQITNLITLLHQEQIPRHKEGNQTYIEVEPKHMEATLLLFKELWLTKDEELYFRVLSTFKTLKENLKKKKGEEYKKATFKIREDRPKGIAYSTFNQHIKELENYNLVKRIGGDNKFGFIYSITRWEDNISNAEEYQKLLTQIQKLKN